MSDNTEILERLETQLGCSIIRIADPLQDENGEWELAKLAIEESTEKHISDLSGLYLGIDQPRAEHVTAIISHDRVKRLYIDQIPIVEIPSSVFELNDLEFLFFRGNQFREISHSIKALRRLRALAITRNHQFESLSQEIAALPKLIELRTDDLPAARTPPREILMQGIEPVRNYFDSVNEAEEIDYLYEAKMVFVGRGFTGKTSLVRKLTRPNYHLEIDIPSTPGIAIDTWDVGMPLENSDRFRLNIWDFAGQEKYDATHQFFITERTVYVFVTEARQESNYLDFDYWLNIVSMLGNRSPVIVVQNKIDVRRKSLSTEKYGAQFPNIVDFVDVSCADGYEDTVNRLAETIREAIRRLPQLGDKLPAAWVNVRMDLEALNSDWVEFEEYLEICSNHGLSPRRAEFLSRYLNDLGVIVHHHDDPVLQRIVVVNPDWAVDGVYRVLDSRRILENQGRFNQRDLESIWSDERYTGRRPELLALMENYQLCFQIPNTDEYIAPELLAANPVDYKPISRDKCLTFIYQYAFMPAGLINRLIVRLHRQIDGRKFWRFGVVIRYGGARAAIVENDSNRTIRIDVEGAGDSKKEILAIIRREFADIYGEFNRRITYEQLIPCNCELCRERVVASLEPHYFDWNTVQRFAQAGIQSIRCEGESLAEVNVSTLMGEVADQVDDWAEFDQIGRKGSLEPRRDWIDWIARIGAQPWEKISVVAIGTLLVFSMLAIALVVPRPTEFQAFIFRVCLALAAGGIGAIIPGVFEFRFRQLVRAGSAAAFFATVYFVNPPAIFSEAVSSGEEPGVWRELAEDGATSDVDSTGSARSSSGRGR